MSEKQLRNTIVNYFKKHPCRKERLEKIEKAGLEELQEIYLSFEKLFPTEWCPLCNFEKIADKDLIDYIYGSTGKTEENFRNEIKIKVKDYADFKNKYGRKKC